MAQRNHMPASETASTERTATDTGLGEITIRFNCRTREAVEEALATRFKEHTDGADGVVDPAAARQTLSRTPSRVKVRSVAEADALRHELATVELDTDALTVRCISSVHRVIGDLDDAMAECGYDPVFEDELAIEQGFRGYQPRESQR